MIPNRLGSVWRRRLVIALVVVPAWWGAPAVGFGQETLQQQPNTQAYPGMAEIVPRSAAVSSQAGEVRAKIEAFRDVSRFEKELQEALRSQEELDRRVEKVREVYSLSYDHLLPLRQDVERQIRVLNRLLQELSESLANLDGVSQEWSSRKEFWEEWKKAVEVPLQGAYREAFREVEKNIADIVKQSRDVFGPYAALQKRAADLLEKNNLVLGWVQKSLGDLRGRLLAKNAPSLFSREFYQSWNSSLGEELHRGFAALKPAEEGILQRQGWILALQILLAVFAGILIRVHRQRLAAEERWQFLWKHPWATGCFLSVSLLSLLYTGIPSLGRFLIWLVVVISASFMVSSLLREERSKVLVVFSLAAFSILTMGLRLISFPQPLFRIYFAVLAAIGILGFWWALRSRKPAPEKKYDLFSWLLRLGMIMSGGALLAQIGGYEAFSSWLLQSSAVSVFVLLSTHMSILLAEGSIGFLAGHAPLPKTFFFESLRREASSRLKLAARIALALFGGLYLLKVWGVDNTVGEAWNRLLGFAVSMGTVTISVRTALLAALFLYLSVMFSSLIQLFLDREFFPSRKMERGQRELVKKLFHYGLILIGFLLAMGAFGIELQNFAVLAGAFGIGIGFGLQNIVNNFVSGLILLFERPITVGDVVVFQGEWGKVSRIGLRSTIVETFDRSEIIIPNSHLVSEAVTNWTLSNYTARCIVAVGVAYGTDIGKVLQILETVGKGHPEVLADPPPSALFIGFGESSLDFELRVWIATINNRLGVKSDLGRAIAARFQEEGIEIPFPQRDLHLRSVDERVVAAARGQGLGTTLPSASASGIPPQAVAPAAEEPDHRE
ncbi:MAG: mechanosensitive ion channel [Deltaproteobacteria bacterium]|nr:mechanosensitive ion channel [Deltaproteobacteria bacterium]